MGNCRNIKLAILALSFLCGVQGGVAQETGMAQFVQSGKFRVQVAQQRVDSLKTALLGRFFSGQSEGTDSAWGRYAGLFQIGASTDAARLALPMPLRFGSGARWKLLIEPLAGAQFERRQNRGGSGFGRLKVAFSGRLLNEGLLSPSLNISARTNIATGKDNPLGPGRGDFWARLVAAKTVARFSLQARSTYRQQSLLARERHEVARAELSGTLSGAFQAAKRCQLYGELAGTARLVRLDTRRRKPGIVSTLGVAFAPHPQVLCNAAVRYRSDHTYSLQPEATIRF
ncbi:MAG: hypothetical protein GKR89_25785 [Candidatus Latescibacteria bacterium]|nr:hypothetical protein [Candidatus Latescibacterota bacterium]